jgi:protein involved in polysaccharide export with SLBB domain
MINPGTSFCPAVMTLFLICAAIDGLAQAKATEPESSQITCREITVYGAVRTPAHFDATSNVSVAKALAMVGGPNEHAGKTLHVLHPCNCSKCSDAGSKVYEYNVADVLRAKDTGVPSLVPGDILVVDEVSVVFMTGNVHRKQEVKFNEGLTVVKAIAFAGGVSMPGDSVIVRIYRKLGNSGYQKTIMVDLNAVTEHRADDIKLEPWDIVDVSDGQGHFESPRMSPHFWDTPIKPRKDNSGS